MWDNISIERCQAFINCQLGLNDRGRPLEPVIRPTVTISRMAGSGGHTVAAKLAEFLQARAPVEWQWTVFDRNLMEKVLEDHHLNKRIAEFLPENHRPVVTDIVEGAQSQW